MILPPEEERREPLRETDPQPRPPAPGRPLGFVVHPQGGEGGASEGGETDQVTGFEVGSKMIGPMIVSGVEPADFRAGRRIDAGDLDAFAQIARPARQRPIGIGIRASSVERYDVLHLEREVEDQFRRVTILAPVLGSLTDGGIRRIHAGEGAIVRR